MAIAWEVLAFVARAVSGAPGPENWGRTRLVAMGFESEKAGYKRKGCMMYVTQTLFNFTFDGLAQSRLSRYWVPRLVPLQWLSPIQNTNPNCRQNFVGCGHQWPFFVLGACQAIELGPGCAAPSSRGVLDAVLAGEVFQFYLGFDHGFILPHELYELCSPKNIPTRSATSRTGHSAGGGETRETETQGAETMPRNSPF